MSLLRRDPRGAARLSEDQLRLVWQLVSLLLDYPTPAGAARHQAVRTAVADLPEAVRGPLRRFVDEVESWGLERAQREYVETFDHTRRCCLYLTYFTYGDTRRRGVALLRLKQLYRRHGLQLTADELPDHLAVVLEFGACADLAAAGKVLRDYRPGIEMLRIGLRDRRSPWAHVVDALAATLPVLELADEAAVRRLVQQGPPQEDVGLPAYAMDPRLNPHPSTDAEAVGDQEAVSAGVRS